MKRKVSLFLISLICLSCLTLAPFGAFAQDSDQTPELISIKFKNAAVDGDFSSDVLEYGLTLEDNSKSPTLESYEIKGNADIFIAYTYDKTNHQTGLTATLQYETGSTIYNFVYSNPMEYAKTDNNLLSSIYCTYGEIMPKINDEDIAYKLYIPSDLTDITITPVTQDINAYCAPIQLTLGKDQEPKITVISIASDGSKREYLLNIKRVDKTTEEVKAELAAGKDSFVEGTLLYQRPEFLIVVGATLGGIIIIVLLFVLTKRIAVVPYDKEEKPFYKTAEEDETESQSSDD